MPPPDSVLPEPDDQPKTVTSEASESRPPKVADRPHGWTIAIGVAAIAVSTISSSVSLFSAHLASENFHLQNRAWLYVKEARWESYWFRATLINRGKTPTNQVEPTCTELDVDDRSGNKPTVIGPVPLRFGPIPPDQTEDLTLGIPHDSTNNPARRTTVHCHVDYVDVFRQKHQLNLCYVLMHGGDVSVGLCTEGNYSN
jgi:hypothetical protein